ncbi:MULTISPECIES: response regulator transcription factor [Sphingopyxis]|jgi:two-component system response regulator FixJ|uniref:Two component transcriptional regulator, LuxR family n=1 Tax=Sphingopyxis alaskensis (strain DSM 13593 / LMG 18877 / RB2256) TaxID=317655 RepID=Q1GQA5_SPHAL|nr:MULTISPECIES: response regulator [Sphingopyxis]MBN8846054.1 response regulator transcription factor [Sphingomonadales bacterium]MDZ4366127.1 response regulator [Afipia sp.]ABF54167.1 two component transcriptional regulator, LuxR family [Sphingopyxis alaskensis RB2256]MCM3420786.1 response regulator [Sphingopyxis alaskensis]HEV7312308.1 response regulator [Sphingopyxis sp.]
MQDKRLIHLVDDEEAIRKSAGFMLRTVGFEVRTYASGVEFLKLARTAETGCVLLDVRMPELDGLQVQSEMAQRGINMPVVVLTGHGDVTLAVQAMKAGAVDFIEKPFEKASLLEAIDRGFARIDRVDVRATEEAEAQVRIGVLTPREKEVLDGLARGYPNKTIAYDLGVSSRTVEVHRASLMSKLAVRSLSDALRIAFAAGLGRSEAKLG